MVRNSLDESKGFQFDKFLDFFLLGEVKLEVRTLKSWVALALLNEARILNVVLVDALELATEVRLIG